MSAAECSPCGERFTGVGPFDRHQDRDYSAECGLVRNEHGRWGFPADAAGRERLASLASGQEGS